jgi:hypothetical protein
MGLLDKIKSMLGGNADKVKGGLEKAGDMVDEKTGGKFTDNIDMAEEKIAEVLEVDGEAETEA